MKREEIKMNEEMKQTDPIARERKVIDRFKENFQIFGVASLIYACFYAFCMFENNSGVTYVFLAAGSALYIVFCLKKLEIALKKRSIFYIASMILISVSTFCTDDVRIIIFNKLAMLLLILCFLLDAIYDTRGWGLGKFIASIVSSCVMAIGEICSPFENLAWYLRNKWDKRNYRYLYLMVGVLITIPIFIIVFILLASADAVFRNVADNILKDFSFLDIVTIAVMVGGMFMATYCLMSYMSQKTIKEEVGEAKRLESLIAIPVTSILTMLYLVFSVIQVVYLFMGNMSLPDGYTYAQYAREGFFQLLAVSALNLIIVLVGLCFFKHSRVLKAILAVMSLCTFIMIASSAMRMIIYIQYYYLTFLRMLVLWGLLVLALIFAGVIIYIFTDKFPLFRYGMVVVTLLYVCLAFSHPDYLIARVNLAGTQENRSEFFKGEEYSDYTMLKYMCADAAPAIAEWMEQEGYTYERGKEQEETGSFEYDEYGYISNDPSDCANFYWWRMNKKIDRMSIRNFNVSRYIAKTQM